MYLNRGGVDAALLPIVIDRFSRQLAYSGRLEFSIAWALMPLAIIQSSINRRGRQLASKLCSHANEQQAQRKPCAVYL